MFDDLHLIVPCKAFACRLEHRGRKIESDAFRIGALDSQQAQEPAISGAEVKNSPDTFGNELQQHTLPFGAMRNPIRTREIFQGMFGCCVLVKVRDPGHCENTDRAGSTFDVLPLRNIDDHFPPGANLPTSGAVRLR